MWSRARPERLAAGLGDLHAVAAAVLGIAATDEVSGVLELIEEQDDVLGVHAQCIDQLLLRRALVIAQVTEGHEEAQVHPKEVRIRAPHHLLGQSRQQDHRAGGTGAILVMHDECQYSEKFGIMPAAEIVTKM